MQIETRLFTRGFGWSSPLPADMDSERTLVMAFGASSFADAPDPFLALRDAFPRAKLLGCSTAGEIRQDRVHDESVAVAIARFDHSELRSAGSATGKGTVSFDAGQAVARDLVGPDLRAILVLSDGLDVNGSELVRGIASVAPASVVVTGGLAADGDRFRRTWVWEGGTPSSGRVAAVGLYGSKLVATHGSRGGWDIFGLERRVTRSEGNVLYELDGKPALKLYKEYLGERAGGLPATALLFPLAMRVEDGDEKQLVRTVLAVDEAEQSMTFAGDMPAGSLVQLMRANFDRLIQGASDAGALAGSSGRDAGPALCVSISCIGRRIVLGERTEEEIEATLKALPMGSQQVGYSSYGEISPYASGSCDLHNQTMTVTALREDA